MPDSSGGNTDAEQRRMNERREREAAQQREAEKARRDAERIKSLERRFGHR